jgi:hypothetical protein
LREQSVALRDLAKARKAAAAKPPPVRLKAIVE